MVNHSFAINDKPSLPPVFLSAKQIKGLSISMSNITLVFLHSVCI